MVGIGTAAQDRLFEAARQTLGADGERIVREAADRDLGVPLAAVSYTQTVQLLAAVERDAVRAAGQTPAQGIADDLDRLRTDAESGVGGRLIGALARTLGPAAEPFLMNVCSRLGLSLDDVDRPHLPQIAEAVRREAAVLVGAATARELADEVEETRSARPAGLAARLHEIAVEHIGPDGDAVLSEVCHDSLEVSLDELDIDGLSLLARAVERDGAARIGALRMAAFVTAAREALAAPSDTLRPRLLALAQQQVGPAGALFLKKVCAKHGLPLEAVEAEHLDWLAEVLAQEAAPLVGKQGAAELARSVRGLREERV